MDNEFDIKILTTNQLISELETRFDICVIQAAKLGGGENEPVRQIMSMKGNIHETLGLMVSNLVRAQIRIINGMDYDDKKIDDI